MSKFKAATERTADGPVSSTSVSMEQLAQKVEKAKDQLRDIGTMVAAITRDTHELNVAVGVTILIMSW
ncbi:hypothetical protein BGX31_008464 [Mortierella sp. GBA43]|nr:hypothetical protein BGX31_008464 [Mortierella sp. GBA43]